MTTRPLGDADLGPVPGAERQRRDPPSDALPHRGGATERSGWGEAVTSWPDACRATEAVIDGVGARARRRTRPARQRRHLAQLQAARLVVRQPWRRSRRSRSRPIDIALWDLKGKLLGVPVTQLLGGAHHERLPASRARTRASRASRRRPTGTPGTSRSSASRGASSASARRARHGSAREIERDVEFMRLLRERVGPEPMLMWDRGVNTLTWDVGFAMRLTSRARGARPDVDGGAVRADRPRCVPPAEVALLDADRLGRARVERRGLPRLHRRRRRRRDRLRPGAGRGDHRRPARDRARRGGRRLVQRACLVERDRHRSEPRAVADDAAGACFSSSRPRRARCSTSSSSARSSSRAATSVRQTARASGSRSGRRSSRSTGSSLVIRFVSREVGSEPLC